MSRVQQGGPQWSNGTVPEGTLVGRATGGSVAALTPAQGMALLGVASAWHLPMVVGDYFAPTLNMTTAVPAEATEYAQFIIPSRSCTLDRVGVYAYAGGTTGAVIRLGVRAHVAATFRPGAVLVDAGTVAGTGAGGAREATVSLPLTAGVPYWLTATVQGGAGTRPEVVMNIGATTPAGASSLPSSVNHVSLIAAGVTGALPASPSWTLAASVACIRVYARASA